MTTGAEMCSELLTKVHVDHASFMLCFALDVHLHWVVLVDDVMSICTRVLKI